MMHRPSERFNLTHVAPPKPAAHGLGLSTDDYPSTRLNSVQHQVPHGKMQSVAPARLERQPMQEALRRVGSLDNALPVPTRSDSLKNRKSRHVRPASLGSPTLDQDVDGRQSSDHGEVSFVPRDLDRYPHKGFTPQLPFIFDKSIDNRITTDSTATSFNQHTDPQRSSTLAVRPHFDRSNTSYHTAKNSQSDYGDEFSTSGSSHSYGTSISIQQSQRSSPLRMQFDGQSHSSGRDSEASLELTNLDLRSTPTTNTTAALNPDWMKRRFSGKSDPFSRLPTLEVPSSPHHVSPTSIKISSSNTPRAMPGDLTTDQGFSYNRRCSIQSSLRSQEEESAVKILIEDLRYELRAVSVELAASIQREMDLEDEVDRLKVELPISRDEPNRRTSDYYSDSNGSSIRFPLVESETKIQGLEKMRRKAEQEKAQMRHSMAQKLQEDLVYRKTLELHCQSLEEQLNSRKSAESYRDSISERAEELEKSLNDTRRQLSEERQVKQNVEELLASLREDVKSKRNECDNLRDEIVPQLRARVEGLEMEAIDMQKLVYENARMQQEIEALKTENQTLIKARKLQLDMQSTRSTYEADDQILAKSPLVGLSRSGSLAGNKITRSKRFSFSGRSDIPEGMQSEVTIDSSKDIEEQRDALHRTLKSLIYRQSHMCQQHAKQIRALETERDRAQNTSHRRKGFHVEVQDFRNETEHLRRRADDAIEQKWQCEKGLSALKMDLDRAGQETISLQASLRGHDKSYQFPHDPLASNDLDRAYAELCNVHDETPTPSRAQSKDDFHTRIIGIRNATLSSEIEAQLASNSNLRQRFSAAIQRGTQQQQASARKIVDLQNSLKAAEDNIITAQGESETTLTRHEELVKDLAEIRREMSKRGVVRHDSPSQRRSSTAPPPTMSPNPNRGNNTPRLAEVEWKPALMRYMTPVAGQSRSEVLEKRVRDLEEEAGKAEREIKSIVESMTLAQREVAELQVERDEASRQTRRLQKEILEGQQRLNAITTK